MADRVKSGPLCRSLDSRFAAARSYCTSNQSTPVSSKKSISVFLLLFLCLAGLTAVGLYLLMEYSAGGMVPEERYYRAVYVLQKMDANARMENEDIPVRVTSSDDTENLLLHPDKILVLQHLADELAAVRKKKAKAVFYEACSRLALGERGIAVKLLSDYVIENEYNASHYAMLCRALYDLEDYKSLLLMCREWQERDPACREDRTRYVWAAQYNLGRYADARRVAGEESQCLDWRTVAYDAKAVLAEQGEAKAKIILEQGLAKHPDRSMQILRLWNILKPLLRV